MVELGTERINQILHQEAANKEELGTILRGIYTRYMRLYEKYFADIDALNDDQIAKLRKYHDETRSLVRHYYMDIPLDICIGIHEFEKKYSANLLGSDWHEYLFDSYAYFRENSNIEDVSEKATKAAFSKQALETFYDAMDYVFREGFGTSSQTAETVMREITELLWKE